MDEATKMLAHNCYGYGRWDAPFWFIGPEQGQGRWENDVLTSRYKAFGELNTEGLCDCRKFHERIGERRWHRDSPALQPTWRRLMLVLMAYKKKLTGDKEADQQTLRDYQRQQWGLSADNSDGLKAETCIAELSGLPANNFAVKRDRELFRDARIEKIWQLMHSKKPGFVLIYSKSQWKHWKHITDSKLESPVFVPSPTAPGYSDQYWIEIGTKLRVASGLS